MKIQLTDVQLKKPRTTYEKDEQAQSGVMPVTTLTVEVKDMDAEEVMRLARYAAYKHPLAVSFESPQKDLVEMALRDGEVASSQV